MKNGTKLMKIRYYERSILFSKYRRCNFLLFLKKLTKIRWFAETKLIGNFFAAQSRKKEHSFRSEQDSILYVGFDIGSRQTVY